MWDRLSVATGPVSLPVTLAEAKAHLLVHHDDDDALITSQIEIATAMIDGPGGIGYILEPQTLKIELDCFPSSEIDLLVSPVTGVTEIAYTDVSGTPQTVAEFDLRIIAGRGYLSAGHGLSWPATRAERGAVTVTFTAGIGAPPLLRSAILLLLGDLYRNREGSSESELTEIPHGVRAIMDRFRARSVLA